MSQSVNAPTQVPELLQNPVVFSTDEIIISKKELHSLRFRVRILKKFLNRLSMRLDTLAFQKSTAPETVEVH